MSVVDPFEDIEQHAIEDAQNHDRYEQSKFWTDNAVTSLTDEIDRRILTYIDLPKTPKPKRPLCNNIGRKGWYDPHRH